MAKRISKKYDDHPKRYIMVNPINLDMKFITTKFGSPYFMKFLKNGYLCKFQLISWVPTYTQIEMHTGKRIERKARYKKK